MVDYIYYIFIYIFCVLCFILNIIVHIHILHYYVEQINYFHAINIGRLFHISFEKLNSEIYTRQKKYFLPIYFHTRTHQCHREACIENKSIENRLFDGERNNCLGIFTIFSINSFFSFSILWSFLPYIIIIILQIKRKQVVIGRFIEFQWCSGIELWHCATKIDKNI